MDPLRIALVSSEAVPFAKTGGLADVTSALAGQLAAEGHDARVFLPMYRRVQRGAWTFEPLPELQDVELVMGGRSFWFSVSAAELPGTKAEALLVRCPELYDREGLYTQDDDEHLRFAFLTRAAIESCQRLGWGPDVFHCNDWHTGLLPLYLHTRYAWDRLFAKTRTVLTIHNIGYQGVFGDGVLPALDLDNERSYFWQEDLAAGHVNFLKTGLLYADAITTVSETYAREIQGDELGMGLGPLLRQRADRLRGIVNGIDTEIWNPKTDPALPANFDARSLKGKAKCKAALQESFDLPQEPDVPLFGIVSRMTAQKGFELLPEILPILLHEEALQLVVLGSGEARHEEYFQWLRDVFPAKVAVYRGYNEDLAHRIEAGADLFLMPSRYEPCGLNQMYSLRYGTIPIVRRTGGLADTVEQVDLEADVGTGYLFGDFTSQALLATIRYALGHFGDRAAWTRLVRRAMAVDWSWKRQVRRYLDLYEELGRS